jgi:hypothetical protein
VFQESLGSCTSPQTRLKTKTVWYSASIIPVLGRLRQEERQPVLYSENLSQNIKQNKTPKQNEVTHVEITNTHKAILWPGEVGREVTTQCPKQAHSSWRIGCLPILTHMEWMHVCVKITWDTCQPVVYYSISCPHCTKKVALKWPIQFLFSFFCSSLSIKPTSSAQSTGTLILFYWMKSCLTLD